MRYVVSGEPTGSILTAVVYGVPAGLRISTRSIDSDLGRWAKHLALPDIPDDYVMAISGLREGRTTGEAVVLCLDNEAFANALSSARSSIDLVEASSSAPKHAYGRAIDGCGGLVGSLKRDVPSWIAWDPCQFRLDAARVIASGIAREFLADLGIELESYVTRVGDAAMTDDRMDALGSPFDPLAIETSSMRCPDARTDAQMKAEVARFARKGETLGGQFVVSASGLLAGIGDVPRSGASLNGRLARALFSVDGVCAVEFGQGVASGRTSGPSEVDRVKLNRTQGFARQTNRSGGLECGMSTGMPLQVKATVAASPVCAGENEAFDLDGLEACSEQAHFVSTCAIPSSAVVAEGEVAFVLASMYQEKFGGDCMADVRRNVESYAGRLRQAAR